MSFTKEELGDVISASVTAAVQAILSHQQANVSSPSPPTTGRSKVFGSNYTAFMRELERREVKFTGESGQRPGYFLTALNELRLAYQVTEKEALEAVTSLVEGPARLWYSASKSSFQTWDDFVADLRANFVSRRGDQKWKQDMRDRTQAPNEPGRDFVYAMQIMNNGLSRPMPEDELVELMIDNLNVDYRPAIGARTFATVADLAVALRDIAFQVETMREYRPPPSRLLTDRDFGNPGLLRRPRAIAVEDPVVQAAEVTIPQQKICTNCDRAGHTRDDCGRPRRLHCFWCGKLDFTVRTCDCADAKARRTENSNGSDRSQQVPPRK